MDEDTRGRKHRWIALSAFAVVLLGAAAVSVVLVVKRGGQSDEEQIKGVLVTFAAAVDAEDQPAMLKILCQDEAAEMTDADDFEPDAPRVQIDASHWQPPTISDVRVFGDVASATLAQPPTVSTLYLRKETGSWKVCAPAADQIPAGKPS
ncbi:hypothetical protein [Amycolatopsis sp.]|uniref:Rv0361 family membrane protein n=1 Tax=Amycolatopsis sp. TaxID=37632 RepID=UPI002CE717D5|nr:hypothetical protein [Amycolatopsis sp.]HVV09524.1 hypothetical protein [Amycolatopsis sp.]